MWTNGDNELEIKIHSDLAGIYNDLYSMIKGMRDCCLHNIEYEYWDKVKSDLELVLKKDKDYKHIKMYYRIHNQIGQKPANVDVFFYRFPHQLKIYKVIDKMKETNYGNYTVEYVSEWMLGMLFNYSAESMEEYLNQFKDPNETYL